MKKKLEYPPGTHWAKEVGDAKMADFNLTSFRLATIFKIGCWI